MDPTKSAMRPSATSKMARTIAPITSTTSSTMPSMIATWARGLSLQARLKSLCVGFHRLMQGRHAAAHLDQVSRGRAPDGSTDLAKFWRGSGWLPVVVVDRVLLAEHRMYAGARNLAGDDQDLA